VDLAGDVAGPCGGKYLWYKNGLTKTAKINVCVYSNRLYRYLVICKVVLFRFCGTRETTLNKQCLKLRVSWKSFVLSQICI